MYIFPAIPSKLFVHGNATATANNIAAHEWLFRFGMVGDLVGAIILIFLVLAFYRLFKRVDQYLAVLVVVLGGVMPALIYFGRTEIACLCQSMTNSSESSKGASPAQRLR